MKKVLLLFLLLISVSLNAQDSNETQSSLYLKVLPVDTLSSVTLELYLSTPDTSVGALELYITLPGGLTTFSSGTLNTEACSATHCLTEGIVDNRLFVSIVSPELTSFTPSEAPLCTWQCDLSSLADGSYAIEATGKFAVGIADNAPVCYTSPDQSASITIGEGGSTSINTPHSTMQDVNPLIFNLQGVRLSTPREGSINIINGKKIKL